MSSVNSVNIPINISQIYTLDELSAWDKLSFSDE